MTTGAATISAILMAMATMLKSRVRPATTMTSGRRNVAVRRANVGNVAHCLQAGQPRTLLAKSGRLAALLTV
eukprot:1145931-Prymnesium_polylepis.2